MIDRTEERFGLRPERLAADTAYGSAATLHWIVNEKKIAPHIPVIDKSKREDGSLAGRTSRSTRIAMSMCARRASSCTRQAGSTIGSCPLSGKDL